MPCHHLHSPSPSFFSLFLSLSHAFFRFIVVTRHGFERDHPDWNGAKVQKRDQEGLPGDASVEEGEGGQVGDETVSLDELGGRGAGDT